MGNFKSQLQNLLSNAKSLLAKLRFGEFLDALKSKLKPNLSQKSEPISPITKSKTETKFEAKTETKSEFKTDPKIESQPTKIPLQAKIKSEFLEVWDFTQTTLVPTLWGFADKAITKLDPPLSSVANSVGSNPVFTKTVQQIQANSLWIKASIALAPIKKSLDATLKPVISSSANSEKVKLILAKPLGTLALVLALLVLLSLRPHHQTASVVAPPVAEIIPAESGDAPILPEKVLITNIQAQVADISISYGEALINSVQTNFRLGRLIVQLSDAWYQLNPDLQERLVADLQKRSEALSFKKLFLIDPEQHLLARSGMVTADAGMIILRR